MYALLSERRTPDAAHALIKEIRKSYPHISHNTKLLISKNLVPMKQNLAQAGREIGEYATVVGSQLRHAKGYLIAGAVGYALIRMGRYCSKWHPAEDVKEHIRQEPLKSALVALGIGLIVGRIL